MHLITYNDKKLFATKLDYFIHEKKLLTVKHSFRFLFYYIDNQPKIIIFIDYQKLNY